MTTPNQFDEVLRAVGHALSVWSAVELELSDLFTALADPMPEDRACGIFDAVVSLEIRLTLVDKLMELEGLPDVEACMWGKISDRITKAYKKRRHPLAHFTLVSPDARNLGIAPFLTNDKIRSKDYKILKTLDIDASKAHFSKLAEGITWFKNQVRARRRFGTGTPPFGADPPLIAEMRLLAAESLAKS